MNPKIAGGIVAAALLAGVVVSSVRPRPPRVNGACSTTLLDGGTLTTIMKDVDPTVCMQWAAKVHR